MSEAQGGVARDGARSVQDLRHAIGRHVDLSGQFFSQIWSTGLSGRPLCEENSATEIAATGKSGYAIGGTESQRLNGHGGLATAGSDETAAVA
jgi:hypothetical protein